MWGDRLCCDSRSGGLEDRNSAGRHPRRHSIPLVTQTPGLGGDLQKQPAGLPVRPRWEQTRLPYLPSISSFSSSGLLLSSAFLSFPCLLSSFSSLLPFFPCLLSQCLFVLFFSFSLLSSLQVPSLLFSYLPFFSPFLLIPSAYLLALLSFPLVYFPPSFSPVFSFFLSLSFPLVFSSPPSWPGVCLLYHSSLPGESVAELWSELFLLVASGPWRPTPVHQWCDSGRWRSASVRLAGWPAIHRPLWTEDQLQFQVRKSTCREIIHQSQCFHVTPAVISATQMVP